MGYMLVALGVLFVVMAVVYVYDMCNGTAVKEREHDESS